MGIKTAKVGPTFSLTQCHWQLYSSVQTVHDFLLVFHCNYVSILHNFRDIVDDFPNLKMSRDVTTPLSGTVCRP